MSVKRIDIRLSKEANDFQKKENTQCVSYLFLRKLDKKCNLIINNTRMLYFNLYISTKSENLHRYEITSNFFDGFLYLDEAKLAEYERCDTNYSKKEFWLVRVFEYFLSISELFGWEKQTFIDAYNECMACNINCGFFFKDKLFTSPNKEYSFGLYYELDINIYNIYEVLYDKKKKEIARRKCYSRSGMIFYISWASWEKCNDKFYYKFNGPSKVFECTINSLLSNEQYDLDKTDSQYFK